MTERDPALPIVELAYRARAAHAEAARRNDFAEQSGNPAIIAETKQIVDAAAEAIDDAESMVLRSRATTPKGAAAALTLTAEVLTADISFAHLQTEIAGLLLHVASLLREQGRGE